MIMIVATFAQALSGQAASVNIIGVLVVWRFIVRRALKLISTSSNLNYAKPDGRWYRR